MPSTDYKKNFNNIINCSESDVDIFDEVMAEYYYSLPISFQKVSPLNIKIDLNIKLGDIAVKNKRKIKIFIYGTNITSLVLIAAIVSLLFCIWLDIYTDE